MTCPIWGPLQAPVETIVARCDHARLRALYDIPEFETSDQFLRALCKRLGKLSKGGLPDLDGAARSVLQVRARVVRVRGWYEGWYEAACVRSRSGRLEGDTAAAKRSDESSGRSSIRAIQL